MHNMLVTCRTVAAARRAGARVIRSPRRGRGAQMNAGAEQARGQLLLFLHADTHLPAGAVSLRAKCARCQIEQLGAILCCVRFGEPHVQGSYVHTPG